MPSAVIIDPKNLSNLYFASKDAADADYTIDYMTIEPYVHPNIAISDDCSVVVNGRGLVATAAIPAGTCLFVTPPTVMADKMAVRAQFLATRTADLAQLAEQSLLQAMRRAIDEQNHAVVHSVLALVGGTTLHNEIWSAAKQSISDIVLGKCKIPVGEQVWQAITDDDLLQIVRRNAFGPDFCTYDNLESYWRRNSSASQTRLPPHLLGMYPFAAMLNHSCLANAVRVYAGEVMVAHACQDIAAGEEIVWSYLPPTSDVKRRRATLQQQHGFVCQCQRCRVEELAIYEIPLSVAEWNDRLVDVATLDAAQTESLFSAYRILEAQVFGADSLSNEAKRYLRVGHTYLHMNYLNAALANQSNFQSRGQEIEGIRNDVLAIATQLHFSFCACHNASTEDLSILHLCYDLVRIMHQTTADQSTTMPKVRFWTEQLKKAHMTRYGELGMGIESVRKCMTHTKRILQQRDGLLEAAEYPFI